MFGYIKWSEVIFQSICNDCHNKYNKGNVLVNNKLMQVLLS